MKTTSFFKGMVIITIIGLAFLNVNIALKNGKIARMNMSNVFALADWENPGDPEGPTGPVCTTEVIDHNFTTDICYCADNGTPENPCTYLGRCTFMVVTSSYVTEQCLNIDVRNGECRSGTTTINNVYTCNCLYDPIESSKTSNVEVIDCSD
jgi:hypothetical protein